MESSVIPYQLKGRKGSKESFFAMYKNNLRLFERSFQNLADSMVRERGVERGRERGRERERRREREMERGKEGKRDRRKKIPGAILNLRGLNLSSGKAKSNPFI